MPKNSDLELSIDVKDRFSGIRNTLVNFVIPLIALVYIVIVGLVILKPSYDEIPILETELASKTTLRNTLKSKLATLNKLVDFSSVVQENSDLVNKVLVSEELVPALLTQIDQIVRESGLEVSRLNYALGTTNLLRSDLNYDFVSVNLSVTGSLDQLRVFLDTIENAARIVNVDVVRYSFSENQEGESEVSATMVLVSPYLYVESEAVTEDPIDLDISGPKFTNLINRIKVMRYYDPYNVDVNVPVVEANEEELQGGGEDLGVFSTPTP